MTIKQNIESTKIGYQLTSLHIICIICWQMRRIVGEKATQEDAVTLQREIDALRMTDQQLYKQINIMADQ